MSLIHNERWKLTATGLNGLAITTIAAGALTPLIAATYGIAGASGGLFALLVSLIWLSTGVCLHLIARAILGRMKE